MTTRAATADEIWGLTQAQARVGGHDKVETRLPEMKRGFSFLLLFLSLPTALFSSSSSSLVAVIDSLPFSAKNCSELIRGPGHKSYGPI